MVTLIQTLFLENLEFSAVTKRRNSGPEFTEFPQEFFFYNLQNIPPRIFLSKTKNLVFWFHENSNFVNSCKKFRGGIFCKL
jgi:hypothetical protein